MVRFDVELEAEEVEPLKDAKEVVRLWNPGLALEWKRPSMKGLSYAAPL